MTRQQQSIVHLKFKVTLCLKKYTIRIATRIPMYTYYTRRQQYYIFGVLRVMHRHGCANCISHIDSFSILTQ
jgi:hypothetical protein